MLLRRRREAIRQRGLALAEKPFLEAPPLHARPADSLRIKHHVVHGRNVVRPLRVAHVTDVHAGISTPLGAMQQAIWAVRRSAPDVVVLTGDYLNRSLKFVERLRRFVGALPGPKVAILGNHDYWSGADGVTRALESERVKVLRNQNVELTLPHTRLTVVGVDDETTGHADVERAFHGVAHRNRALVLTHHPKTADAIDAAGGRLVLAGHTHGGQIAVPVITRTISRLGGNRYIGGWYRLREGGHLYVNAGIGSGAVRVRVGEQAAPEVAIFDFRPQG